jgi:hypothetical protein
MKPTIRMLLAFSLLASALVVCLSSAYPAMQQSTSAPAQSPKPDAGSEERVRITPHSFLDDKYGATVSVFESVPVTPATGTNSSPSNLRLYLSPLCQIIPFDDQGKKVDTIDLGNGWSRADLRVLYYYEDLFSQAASRLSVLYEKKYQKEQISLLAISILKFELSGIKGAKPAITGDIGARVAIPNSEVISFEIPTIEVPKVTALANSAGGLKIDTLIVYNSSNLLRKMLSWTVEDVRNTKAFRDLQSSGSNYVNASQVQDIFQEISRSQNFMQYEDPGLEGDMDKKGMEVFNKLLDSSTEFVIKSAQKASEIDEEVRKATGITAKDYQPVRLNFQYGEKVLSANSYQEANSKAEDFFMAEQTSLSISAKGSYGPISGRASYNRNTQKTEHTNYQNEREFKMAQEKYRTENGDGVRFEPRGINLVEKSRFNSRVNLTASAVLIRPVSSTGRLMISSSTGVAKRTFDRYLEQSDAITKKLDESTKSQEVIRQDVASLKSLATVYGLEPGTTMPRIKLPGAENNYMVINRRGFHFYTKGGAEGDGTIPNPKNP